MTTSRFWPTYPNTEPDARDPSRNRAIDPVGDWPVTMTQM